MRKQVNVYHVHYSDAISILNDACDTPRVVLHSGPYLIFKFGCRRRATNARPHAEQIK